MENNLSDFKDSRSLFESAALCAASATILRMGFGEVCSVFSRCFSPSLVKVKPEKLAKCFNKAIDYLKIAHGDFINSANRALETERSESPDKGA